MHNLFNFRGTVFSLISSFNILITVTIFKRCSSLWDRIFLFGLIFLVTKGSKSWVSKQKQTKKPNLGYSPLACKNTFTSAQQNFIFKSHFSICYLFLSKISWCFYMWILLREKLSKPAIEHNHMNYELWLYFFYNLCSSCHYFYMSMSGIM